MLSHANLVSNAMNMTVGMGFDKVGQVTNVTLVRIEAFYKDDCWCGIVKDYGVAPTNFRRGVGGQISNEKHRSPRRHRVKPRRNDCNGWSCLTTHNGNC
jgi:hypothetical protein